MEWLPGDREADSYGEFVREFSWEQGEAFCRISCDGDYALYINGNLASCWLPPIDYIQNYRLRQAKFMLKHTGNPLTAIANDCGFCDSAHFSRLFKQKYQCLPLTTERYWGKAKKRLHRRNDYEKTTGTFNL